MGKPKIAIDIDDVLISSTPDIIADYNRRWNAQVPLDAFYAKHDEVIWGGVDEGTAVRRANTYLHSMQFIDREPREESFQNLSQLAKGYDLHVLTGRSNIPVRATEDWLEQHFPGIFSSVNFSNMFNEGKERSKGEMCVEMGVQALIDDNAGHVASAADYGLQGILFGDYPWNQVDKLPPGVIRCADWPAVLEYFNARTS